MISINLVPADCLLRHTRLRRIRIWSAAAVAALLVTTVLGGRAWWQGQLHAREEARIAALRDEEATLAAARVRLMTERTRQVHRALALTRIQADGSIASGLRSIADHAPEGVLLTRLRTRAEEVAPRPQPAATAQPAAPKPAAPANAAAVTPPEPIALVASHVEITGLALDHADVEAFIAAVERHSAWKNVTLVRAVRDAGAADLLSFELDCRRPVETP